MYFLSKNVTNILVPTLFGFAKNFRFCNFSATISISVSETLHVAYKKYKLKRKFSFFCKYQMFHPPEFSLVVRTRENSDAFNTLGEIHLVFTSKK